MRIRDISQVENSKSSEQAYYPIPAIKGRRSSTTSPASSVNGNSWTLISGPMKEVSCTRDNRVSPPHGGGPSKWIRPDPLRDDLQERSRHPRGAASPCAISGVRPIHFLADSVVPRSSAPSAPTVCRLIGLRPVGTQRGQLLARRFQLIDEGSPILYNPSDKIEFRRSPFQVVSAAGGTKRTYTIFVLSTHRSPAVAEAKLFS